MFSFLFCSKCIQVSNEHIENNPRQDNKHQQWSTEQLDVLKTTSNRRLNTEEVIKTSNINWQQRNSFTYTCTYTQESKPRNTVTGCNDTPLCNNDTNPKQIEKIPTLPSNINEHSKEEDDEEEEEVFNIIDYPYEKNSPYIKKNIDCSSMYNNHNNSNYYLNDSIIDDKSEFPRTANSNGISDNYNSNKCIGGITQKNKFNVPLAEKSDVFDLNNNNNKTPNNNINNSTHQIQKVASAGNQQGLARNINRSLSSHQDKIDPWKDWNDTLKDEFSDYDRINKYKSWSLTKEERLSKKQTDDNSICAYCEEKCIFILKTGMNFKEQNCTFCGKLISSDMFNAISLRFQPLKDRNQRKNMSEKIKKVENETCNIMEDEDD